MTKIKKIISLMILITILLTAFIPIVFAAELKTQLQVVKNTSETKYLENDQGYISKKIISSNSEIGEVTIDLSLSNIKSSVEGEKDTYDNTEIFIIVHENIVTDGEKFNTYVSYIDTLATKVFEKNSNTKIGIVGMKGTVSDFQEDENGNAIWGENDEGDVDGTADNAEIAVNLTSSSEELKTGLQNMNTSKTKYRSNLQAAIRLANNSYSDNVNKILILLHDDVPAIAIGINAAISYGGWFSEYATAEEAVIAKHNKIANQTSAEILTLKSNNVDFILLRPDDTSYDEKWYNTDTGEVILEFDGSPYVQRIYGTLENPTYGKMYSLNNENLEKIVTEYIYKDILEEIGVDIESAVIKEYFSDEILENFDIVFNNESIDTTNLSDDKYVEWNIGDLAENESANLEYTLKIKNMKNAELLDKEISTSEKTELTYINYLDTETTLVSTDSPKVKLTEIKEELTATVNYDPTSVTTGSVKATIKTNKKVNAVEGWTLSEDGMILTKQYTTNATETVHLVDLDGMTKDVEIKISNIIVEQPKNEIKNEKDPTLADKELPNTGKVLLFWIIGIIAVSGIVAHIRYKKLYM